MILFDNIMVEIKISQKVIELFFCGSKLDIPIAYFRVTKDIRLHSAHYFIMRIPHKGDTLTCL